MKMSNLKDLIKSWVGLTTIILLNITIITVWFYIWLGDKYMDAFIGFFGSIIGGAITLIGVKYILEKEDGQNDTKRYAEVQVAYFKINPFIQEINNTLITEEGLRKINMSAKAIYKNSNELVTLSLCNPELLQFILSFSVTSERLNNSIDQLPQYNDSIRHPESEISSLIFTLTKLKNDFHNHLIKARSSWEKINK